ncbi:MAG: hypothetical protein GF355_13885, partial [Candidatus Eisenbacteria bacterium]|nr:hypothetical protein [Candidatus Eisenbacteria bacterium]
GDPTRILAQTRSRIFLSEDAGRNWTELLKPSAVRTPGVQLQEPLQIAALLVDPLRPGTAVFVTRDRGTLRTTDWGQEIDWFRGNLHGPVEAAAVDPTIGSILYAVVGGDLYRSVDRGEHWGSVGWVGRRPLARVEALMVDPGQPARLLALIPEAGILKISRDGGRSWESRDLPTGEWARGLAIHRQGMRHGLVLGTDCGVWSSHDGGRTWDRFSSGLEDLTVLDLAMEPEGARSIWAATDCGLMRLQGPGGRWERVATGSGHGRIERLATALLPDPVLWALDSRAVWSVSAASGVHREARFDAGTEVTGMVVRNGRQWLCGTAPDSLWVASTDGGALETISTLARPAPAIDPWLSWDAGQPLRLLLGCGPLLASADSGRTWETMPQPPEAEVVWDAARVSEPGGDLLLATDAGLFRCTDTTGVFWDHAGPGRFAARKIICDPLHPGRWFLQSDAGAYITIDAGRTWTVLDLPEVRITSMEWDPAAEELMVGLEDQGVRWVRLASEWSGDELHLEPIHVTPNPFHGEANLSFALPADVPDVTIHIFSVYGNRVRTIRRAGPFRAGETLRWTWDGTTEAGQPVATGVYIFRSRAAGRLFGGKALYLR